VEARGPAPVPEPEPGPQPEEAPTAKVGARNSAADLDRIQAAHDQMVALGATCGGAAETKVGADDDLAKALADNERLTRLVEAQGPRIEALGQTIETLQKRIEAVAATPAAPKAIAGLARAVSKAEDVNPGGGHTLSAEELKKYLDSLPEDERGQLQLRAALRQPIPVWGRP